MSDYPTWSQRKAWNNDGMDPDWKPEPTPENKKSSVYKIKALVDSVASLVALLKTVEERENLEFSTRITMSNRSWNEIVKAFDDVQGTTND